MSLERPKDAFKRKQETEYGVTGKRGEESYQVSVISIKEAVGGGGLGAMMTRGPSSTATVEVEGKEGL